jgi:bacterioferritin-associated ferredoxin
MVVCLCNGVPARRIRRAIDAGATTVDEVTAACGAGSCCHGCHPTIEDLIDEARVTVRPRLVAS